MSSTSDGQAPQIYQETSSTRTGPGGVRETQRTVQDSSSGVKKMAIGHHIGPSSHVVEKEQNLHTGSSEQREEFINLDESGIYLIGNKCELFLKHPFLKHADTEEFESNFRRQIQAASRQQCRIQEISPPPLQAIES